MNQSRRNQNSSAGGRRSQKAGPSHQRSSSYSNSNSSASPVRKTRSNSTAWSWKKYGSNHQRPEQWSKRDSTIVQFYRKMLRKDTKPHYPPAEVLTSPLGAGANTGRGKRKNPQNLTEEGEGTPPKIVRVQNGDQKCLLLRETYAAVTAEPTKVSDELTKKSVTSIYKADRFIEKRDEMRWKKSDDEEVPAMRTNKSRALKKRSKTVTPSIRNSNSQPTPAQSQSQQAVNAANERRKMEKLKKNKMLNRKNAKGQPLFRGQIENILEKLQSSQSSS